MDCGDLNDPVNGVVAVNDTVEGSIANYICDEGFSPDGPVDRTCGSDGMWSGVPPMCEGERAFHLCLCTVYNVFYGMYKYTSNVIMRQLNTGLAVLNLGSTISEVLFRIWDHH